MIRLAVFVVLCGIVPVSFAEEPIAAQLFPPTTLAYAEIANPPQLLATILEHPLREKIEMLPQYQAAVKSPDYRNFQILRRMLEIQLEMDWREALEALTAQGIAIGFDPESQGVAIIVRGKDADTVERLVRKLVNIAIVTGNKAEIEETAYRDRTVYKTKGAAFAVIDDRLILVNRPETGRLIVDRLLEGSNESLESNPRFQDALSQRVASSTIWAFADIHTVYESGAGEHFQKQSRANPLLEVLAGGIMATLRETPWLTANVTAAQTGLSIRASMPHDNEWVAEEREYYFGPSGSGRGAALPAVDETLFTLSIWRDVSEMWLRADDLFDVRIVDGFAEANANLTTLFAGNDFGEDILGRLSPRMGFIAARRDFSHVLPRPAIQLPSMALFLELEDATKSARELRRTFQSMIGFFNVLGAMQGKRQLELGMESLDDGAQLVTADYVSEDGEEEATAAEIIFNFAPSVGFNENRFVIASTKEFARQLITAPQTDGNSGADNTQASLDAAVLKQILADNEEQLIAQNMLSNGNSREEAEVAVNAFLELAGYFRDAAVRLGITDGRLELELDIRLAE